MKLTDEQLRVIAEVAERATDGLYLRRTGEFEITLFYEHGEAADFSFSNGWRNGQLAAHAKGHITALLAHIKALEEENLRYKKGIDTALEIFWGAYYDDNKHIEPDHAYQMRDALLDASKGAGTE